MTDHGHPIEVDLERILPLLAREIYTSPFAFLRENVQNAFDAIRMQKYREKLVGVVREHSIHITLDGSRLAISDSGIGMSQSDLANFFWSIGKSGKHTEEARSAGVVGTFGIGGMANFGVCSRLEVITRPYSGEKTIISVAERDKLSAKENCVFYSVGDPQFGPGTTVIGTLIDKISLDEIANYLQPIVQYLEVPMYVGDRMLSKKQYPTVVRREGETWTVSSGHAKATVWIRALQNGQAETEVEKLILNDVGTDVAAVFSTNNGVTSAYQHGFMLANVPVTTVFGLGGIINSSVLRPTAGREAVTDESRTLVQNLLAAIESGLAAHIAKVPGLPERFSSFYRYLSQHGLWELAAATTVRVYGSNARRRLDTFKDAPKDKVYFARDGHDQSIIQAFSEQGKTVILLSSDGQRQRVESNYLTSYCDASALVDRVTCLRIVQDLSLAEEAFKYQLADKLRRQFLVEGIRVQAGELSHGAMLWIPPVGQGAKVLFVDFRHAQIRRLVAFRESVSFDPVFDIFIRDSVLPHLETAFPELKKRDFDALLRKLQSTVEYFEIDPADISRIHQLASITNMSPESVAAAFGGCRAGVPRPTSVRKSDVVTVAPQVNQVVEEAKGKSLEEIRRELEIRLLE
jgi:molecular chaperone HtpG